MSIATTALWVVGYLGNQSFPLMQKTSGKRRHVLGFQRGGIPEPGMRAVAGAGDQRADAGRHHQVLDDTKASFRRLGTYFDLGGSTGNSNFANSSLSCVVEWNWIPNIPTARAPSTFTARSSTNKLSSAATPRPARLCRKMAASGLTSLTSAENV